MGICAIAKECSTPELAPSSCRRIRKIGRQEEWQLQKVCLARSCGRRRWSRQNGGGFPPRSLMIRRGRSLQERALRSQTQLADLEPLRAKKPKAVGGKKRRQTNRAAASRTPGNLPSWGHFASATRTVQEAEIGKFAYG